MTSNATTIGAAVSPGATSSITLSPNGLRESADPSSGPLDTSWRTPPPPAPMDDDMAVESPLGFSSSSASASATAIEEPSKAADASSGPPPLSAPRDQEPEKWATQRTVSPTELHGDAERGEKPQRTKTSDELKHDAKKKRKEKLQARMGKRGHPKAAETVLDFVSFVHEFFSGQPPPDDDIADVVDEDHDWDEIRKGLCSCLADWLDPDYYQEQAANFADGFAGGVGDIGDAVTDAAGGMMDAIQDGGSQDGGKSLPPTLGPPTPASSSKSLGQSSPLTKNTSFKRIGGIADLDGDGKISQKEKNSHLVNMHLAERAAAGTPTSKPLQGQGIAFLSVEDEDEDELKKHFEGNEQENSKTEKKKQWRKTKAEIAATVPYFIMGQTAFALLVWCITSLKESEEPEHKGKKWTQLMAGFEAIWPGKTALKIHDECKDLRPEFWRWLTYQWTHVGISHVGMNCIMNLVMGWRIEKVNGTARTALMYNVGVFGGSLCFFVGDCHHSVVGMSGGCYSLIGMQWAMVIINWRQKRWPKMTLCILICLAVMDTLTYFGFQKDDEAKQSSDISHTAHFGGAVAGLIIGIAIGENLVVKPWERKLIMVAWGVGIVLVAFCLIWGMLWAPMTIMDPHRWCWTRLVYNRTYFGDSDWHCVRCGTEACINRWVSTQKWMSTVTIAQCRKKGGWDYTE